MCSPANNPNNHNACREVSETKRALDLFCCAGGATRGLQLAGYHVTGVDIRPQPHYCGDAFVQASALDVDLDGYDLIWASPPCQLWSELTPADRRIDHLDLIAPIRERLYQTAAPWIIENVAGAIPQLRSPVMLCGSMFGLGVWRHRYFELGNCDPFFLLPSCDHSFQPVVVSGRGMRKTASGHRWSGSRAQESCDAMQIDWMNRAEVRQAIPPAYSKFLADEIEACLEPVR
jgi:DNA (cytosine-5)-methyltransferase 1